MLFVLKKIRERKISILFHLPKDVCILGDSSDMKQLCLEERKYQFINHGLEGYSKSKDIE